MDILNKVQKLKQQKIALQSHPVRDLDLELKIHYLNALSLLLNVDEKVDEKELDFFKKIITAFELPDEKLDEFIKFPATADEDAIMEMFEGLSSLEKLKVYFLIDAYILAYSDGEFHTSEEQLLKNYIELLNIDSEQEEFVSNLVAKVVKGDPDEIIAILTEHSDKIEPEKISYLFVLFNVDTNLLEKAKKQKNEEKDKIKDEILSKLKEKLKNEEKLFIAPFGEERYGEFIIKKDKQFFLGEVQPGETDPELRERIEQLWNDWVRLSDEKSEIDLFGGNQIVQAMREAKWERLDKEMDKIMEEHDRLKEQLDEMEEDKVIIKKELSFEEVKTYLDKIVTISIDTMNKEKDINEWLEE